MTRTLYILYILMLFFVGDASLSYAQDRPKVQIFGNVYGGGELAQVVTPDDGLEEVLVTDDKLNDGPMGLFNPQAHHQYTTYVHLGSNAEVYGRSFGGGRGHNDSEGPEYGRVIGQTDIVLDGATIWSEIYGGGQMADVRGNALLHFKKGKAGHNAFGGGLGKLGKKDNETIVELDSATDNLPDNRYVPMASADIRKIPDYDAGRDGDKGIEGYTTDRSNATGNTFVVFDGDENNYTHYEFEKARTFKIEDGHAVVTETDQYQPNNPSQLFSINHNIYGGGMTASNVEGNTYVHIRYGMVSQEMMNYTDKGESVWSKVFKSIANAQFCVFGGGYGYHSEIKQDTYVTMDVAGSGGYKYIGEFTQWFANEGKAKYHWDTNTGSPENIYKAADEATWSHGAPGRSAMDIIGGGYNGKVLGTTHVEVSGDVVVRKVYGGGYYASVGNTEVTLKSGIYERVYGGGMIGNVYGTATLNFGQKGLSEDVHDENLHLMVKEAIYGGNDVSGTVGTTVPGEYTHTNNGVTYNVYHPVDDEHHGVRLNIHGGLVLGDVYGAGNGNHPGYGNPDYMEFNLSQHPSENYRQLAHNGTKGTALVYKYRPRTARVIMNIEGNDGEKLGDDPQVDKVRIWGRTFGGGNSCNVGVWDGTADDNAEVYADDASSWHPGDNFQGDGTIHINIGSHVQFGNRNDSHETPNGLFMGSNGEHMITQHTDIEKAKYYHQYYDATTGKYWPGFPVYKEDEAHKTELIPRIAGLKSFAAFINTITTKSDNVILNIADDVDDVWMSNFVGGGYRGSMQAKTAAGKYCYKLPLGVTIGHTVVGGAFNAHIIYRIYATDDGHQYTLDDKGNYRYEYRDAKAGTEGTDYLRKIDEEGPTGAAEKHFLRYNFDGGILDHNSTGFTGSTSQRVHNVSATPTDFITPTTGYNANKDKALLSLDLRNRLDPVINNKGEGNENVHGGIVYGGCFNSGFIEGDVWVDYRCSLTNNAEDVTTDGKGKYYDKTNIDTYTHADNMTTHRALLVFGAGYGEDTTVDGDVYLRLLHNGTSADTRDYPLIYNAFGGGNMGKVSGNTNVYYNVGKLGTLLGSVYGGGYQGEIGGNTYLEMAGGLAINAYGGSREANIGGAAHVWVYDGIKFPAGEDVAEPEKAPLLIGNLYGGNDISGTISGGAKASYAGSQWDAIRDTPFNTYVQVASTKADGSRGFPLIGNLFAGGNGVNNNDPAKAPNVEKSLLHIVGGNILRAFGGGNKATVTNDACILVNAAKDVFTNYTFNPYQKKVLMETVFKGVLNGYHWDETTLVMDPYHVVKMYGGNNVATMDIQPTWNLKDGMIENVYSGGNMGDMTYYNAEGKPATTDGSTSTTTIGVENNADGTNANYTPRGLSITVNSPDINIKNLFGGCRLSNVVPGGYDNEGNLAQNAAFASCENLYGATINILDGKIENVFGGNDVGGKVYFGTNINISGGILGNVYGSGNGDYLYRFDKNATTVTEQIDEKLGFYYDVPEKMGETLIETTGTPDTDTHKILTINRIRPAVDNTFINIAGMEHDDGPSGSGPKRVAAVKGNIFMGGNATTITRDGNFTFGKFKLGSYTTINGLFLGSDGHSYTDNNFIEQFAKLNDIEDMSAETNFESGHELDKQHNPILLNAYLMAVDVQSPPKDFTVKTPLTEAYIGTFCGGGNRGSMLHDKTVEMDFPADLVIFDKIVAGCMNATVNYNQNGTNVQSLGGYVRGLDIANNNGNGNTKIRYTINSQFKPMVMDAEFDKDTGLNKHNDNLATAMGKGFVYEHLNAASDGWLTGCNIYGGCYQSGEIVGDVVLNVNSNMLQVPLTNSTEEAKLKKSIDNGETCFNVFGAGFGQDSHIWGNVHIKMDGTNPSANNIFGGGRNGQLIGNSLIEIRNGRIYSDVVGGSYASHMYGSSQVIVGYPTYYRCKTSGEYPLQRGDQWNTSQQVIKRSVSYLKGDLVPKNVYEQIVAHTAGNATHFDEVNDAPADWSAVDIKIGEGIYGGGYSLATSTSASAGNVTTHKLGATPADLSTLETLHPLNFDGRYGIDIASTEGYGGNSSIMVADVAGAGSGDHISISSAIDANGDDKNDYYYGGIYGDGHLTFCEGFRAADLTGYGYNTASPKRPRLLNTFQRLDLLDVNDCCLELQGAQDFAANQIDATTYSLTRIDELRMNSTISAEGNLAALSETTGTEATGFSTSKVRNYIGFNNLVHYLGALVTNDSFAADGATYHSASGTKGVASYYNIKKTFIDDYSPANPQAFKARNMGTARNCIGLNSGYCLRVQNLGDNGLYYGPIVGVAEVKLLTLSQGEGGGYVYADNIHDDDNNFLNTSGNFVFPGAVGQGDDIADQYIVDDCFMNKFGTPEAITTKNGALDEAHYWYVEGNKYFYNTTLTGYTYKSPPTMEFNLTDNDPNVVLSGIENGSSLNIKKIEWLSTHRGDYRCVLENSTPNKVDDYEFDIEVGSMSKDDSKWTNDMTRYTAGDNANPLTTGKTFDTSDTPIFNIRLQDKKDNSGDENYNNHLDEPEKVKIYLEGETKGQKYEYTITLNIVYLQGPTYEGGVDILNCALPGERIGFSSGGIKIKTPDLMPITETAWEILPLDEIDADGNWKWDTENGVEIPASQYSEDLTGNLTGSIPALYKQNESNIAYIFTAGGHKFPVMPSQDATLKQYRMIVVHNYHRMKDIVAQGIEESVTAGACVYLQDEDDLTKFVEWVNAGKLTEGVNFILQDSIRLTKPLTALSQSFAGTFHGDGYHINLGTHASSLFDRYLTGKVYNLGLVGGTIATNGTLTNCYDSSTDANELRYGQTAYDLSHHFVPTADGYVEGRYANGDYQYATTDRVWSLRTGEPWYGHEKTRHDISHTHDADRWVDTDDDDDENDDILSHTGYNEPLYDGTKVIANKEIHDPISDDVTGTLLGIPASYANDYLFFGQHLDKDNADLYPVHISSVASGDADASKGGNRVYKSSGYYQSGTDGGFHYNRDAWALQPTLTAVDYTQCIAEGDNASTMPAKFSVDSNADYNTDGTARGTADYDNAAYGHVTQNLLVYCNGEDIFSTGNYADNTPEEKVRYHRLKDSYVGGTYGIDYFHLVDKQDYNSPISFNVKKRAWYERKPSAWRNADRSGNPSAWEGLCLPFQYVSTVTGEEEGNVLSHFYGNPTPEMLANPATNDRTLHHEYWLAGFVGTNVVDDKTTASFMRPGGRGETTGIFDNSHMSWDYSYENTYYRTLEGYAGYVGGRNDESSWYESAHTFSNYPYIAQNVPYVVAFPGKGFYEFDLTDEIITFDNCPTSYMPIAVTDNSEMSTTVGSCSHRGTFRHIDASDEALGINAAGDAFDITDGYILPFRTYMTTTTAPTRRYIAISSAKDSIPHEEADEPEDELLEQEGDGPRYDLQGRRIGQHNAQGIQVSRHRKVLVR